jgi:ribose 5-phosphate isomerase B
MRIYFGSDHRGNELRPKLIEFVKGLGYESEDLGMDGDFPLIAQRVVKMVLCHKESRGILICGTGQGMAIASNRYEGIRAVVCNNVEDAIQTREHLNANILALGADRVKDPLSKDIVKVFLTTPFKVEVDRYNRRIEQLKNII